MTSNPFEPTRDSFSLPLFDSLIATAIRVIWGRTGDVTLLTEENFRDVLTMVAIGRFGGFLDFQFAYEGSWGLPQRVLDSLRRSGDPGGGGADAARRFGGGADWTMLADARQRRCRHSRVGKDVGLSRHDRGMLLGSSCEDAIKAVLFLIFGPMK